MEAESSSMVVPMAASCQPARQRPSATAAKIEKNLRSLLVVARLPFVTTSTFDHLVVTQTHTGSQITGFVSGETQARLVFTRRGEQMEIVCMTEDLACAQLAAIESLSSWELVSACLEPYGPSVPPQASWAGADAGAGAGAGADAGAGAERAAEAAGESAAAESAAGKSAAAGAPTS
jgi:hypothetical protein